ncbi:MAG TPA: DUF502 domain-containing protein [Polyangia bacterium]
MGRVQTHVRNKLVAGALAAIPVALTIFILWYVDSAARGLFGIRYPVAGLLVGVGGLYLLGLFVTSLVGRWILGGADALLVHIPGLRDLYQSWKQMAFSPEGDEGIFARVVLVPDETGKMSMMGFSTRKPVEGDPETVCVFVPGSPNPTSGRLYFVPTRECLVLDLPARVALKILISGGNYVPAEIGRQLQAHRAAGRPAPEVGAGGPPGAGGGGATGPGGTTG